MSKFNAQFNKRLVAAIKDTKSNSVKGLRLATAYVKLETQKITPANEGNLKASAYTNVEKDKNFAVGEVGFTAEYAAAVHEKPMVNAGKKRTGKDAKGKYWDPQGKGSNKFLEKTVDSNHDNILRILHKATKF